jgi:hypothetical protein
MWIWGCIPISGIGVKRAVVLMWSLVLFAVFTGCGDGFGGEAVDMQKSTIVESEIYKDIFAVVQDGKITLPLPDTITLVLTNTSDVPHNYGQQGFVEKQMDGDWFVVPADEFYVADIALVLSEHATVQQPFSLVPYQERLTAGEYRIVIPLRREEKYMVCPLTVVE